MKASFLLTLCLSGVMALAVTDPSQGEDSRSLSMDVRVHQARPGQFEMEATLTNISKKPLRLYREFLPWEHRYSLHVVIARGFPGREGVLEENLPIRDHDSVEKVELQPGQTLRGKILLNERFSSLPEEIRARNLYVFWAYEVTPDGTSSVERLGGWVFVARQGARSKGE